MLFFSFSFTLGLCCWGAYLEILRIQAGIITRINTPTISPLSGYIVMRNNHFTFSPLPIAASSGELEI
jgi:hypothetical protein